jgi:hypothetical protein
LFSLGREGARAVDQADGFATIGFINAVDWIFSHVLLPPVFQQVIHLHIWFDLFLVN